MFYIVLENQIHLLIILIFSAYIYLSSLTIRLEPFMKNLGTSFFTPLVLGIMSFLSLNTSISESYLFYAELILIAAVLISAAFKNTKEINTLVYFLLYAFPLATVMLNINFDILHNHIILMVSLFSLLGIILLVIIISIATKRHSLIVLYSGIFSICASLVIPRINSSNIAGIASLLLKASGYTFCVYFFYKSSVHRLESEYAKVSGELNRINENIQREINLRTAHIDQLSVRPQDVRKTDMLTGTYTNKAILDFIEMYIEKNPNSEFSVLLVDIDNFNVISSKLGKNAGNKCIRDLADMLKSIARNDDKIGRFDDNRFLLVMPGTGTSDAYAVVEQLKAKVETTSTPHFKISAGVASYPSDAGNVKDIITTAKKSLYASKK
ncbi:MAG TPA: GGDEF domain-containing protein [Thermoclostridium sp.]